MLSRMLDSDFHKRKLLCWPRLCSRKGKFLRWIPIRTDTQIWVSPDILSLPRKRQCDWLKPQNTEIENISNTALRNEAVKALPRKQMLLNIIAHSVLPRKLLLCSSLMVWTVTSMRDFNLMRHSTERPVNWNSPRASKAGTAEL